MTEAPPPPPPPPPAPPVGADGPGEPAASAPRSRLRISRRTTSMLTAGGLLLVLLAAAVALPVPYVTLGPGPTFNTLGEFDGEALITVEGRETFPTEGQLDITTVTESGGPYGRLGLGPALQGWLDPDVAVVPKDLLYPPGQSAEEIEQTNEQSFTNAESSATVAALRQLDIPVSEVVVVSEIEDGSPADGTLEAGDVIVAVDGTPIRTTQDARDAIQAVEPGETVRIEVRRDGDELVVPVETVAADEGEERAVVGVLLDVDYESDVDVSYGLSGVGGPSAGLMFALGLVDKLTPESVTGGAHVAGTGTIDVDGNVGPIGGIQQKLDGARGKGATVFLVPDENCAAARGDVPDGLRLVRVKTLDDALTSLESIRAGGDAPTC